MRSRRINDEVLLRLIDQVYAAAETPPLWERFLVSLAESLNGRGAGLLQHDMTTRGAISVAVPVDPDVPHLYDSRILDPVMYPNRGMTGRTATLSIPRAPQRNNATTACSTS